MSYIEAGNNVLSLEDKVGSYYLYKRCLSDLETDIYQKILPKEFNEIEKLLQKHLFGKNRILIVDDIDFDGFASCYIVKKYLYEINKELYVDVYMPEEHGVDGDAVNMFNNYDLVIIVDSSTNLVNLYVGLQCDVIILDHHIQYSNSDMNYYMSNTVINCNSKNTSGLETISAGMLTYLVFHEFYNNCCIGKYDYKIDIKDKILDLYELATSSLISDIVDVNEFALKTILNYVKNFVGTSDIIKFLINSSNITIKSLQWDVFPKINYTKRLKDKCTMNLMYKFMLDFAYNNLNNNLIIGRNIKECIFSLSSYVDYGEFIYVDITDIVNKIAYNIDAFKGLVANNYQSKYNKPCVVSIYKKENDIYEISVRSNGYDSFNYFTNIRNIEGGGHRSACGYKIPSSQMKETLLCYKEYLSNEVCNTAFIVNIDDFDVLLNYDLMSIADYNELCFSNLLPIKFHVKSTISTKLNILSDKLGILGIYKVKLVDFSRNKSAEVIPIKDNISYPPTVILTIVGV